MPLERISVIIPTRNEEKLLGSCLDQFTPEIKKQFGIEVIVSDGGSSDSTLAIAARSADKVLQFEDSGKRQTIAGGRNSGAQHAKGNIFVFLNADTQIPRISKFFERISRHMNADPSLVALAVKVQVMPEDRTITDRLFHGFFNQYVRVLNFFGMGMGRGECQIVLRSAFEKIGGYNESLAAGEDFDLYKRLHELGKIRFDGKLLVYESPRRYRKYGYAKVYGQWIRNGVSVLFRKKASSEIWEEVR
ncbi:MAG: glycosyltransferase [Bacteroidota bacterium]|nr:glycosyltransferase [Bacteroidota bacterium]MDP4229926.1 glycosyltransferase [Bacteroidota bacterium]MDP4236071.1 glycosyltransferase [Bacteroidota bacterium]